MALQVSSTFTSKKKKNENLYKYHFTFSNDTQTKKERRDIKKSVERTRAANYKHITRSIFVGESQHEFQQRRREQQLRQDGKQCSQRKGACFHNDGQDNGQGWGESYKVCCKCGQET